MNHQSTIESYLQEHQNKGLLRFITCGSVDDGKSTLIGRLLHDSKMIYEDQLLALEKDSKKSGTQGEEIDLALLVDGLQSEREQGITIDVAYRYFSTDKRKFIIADTPGHEQYTRNMATGASTADLAIILIDARYGVQTQTRRHSYIVSLLGIQNVIVAINKMDLVDFSQASFQAIKNDYEIIIPKLPHHEKINFRYIPICALRGDNVVHSSEKMPWYSDVPLMELLDTIILVADAQTNNDQFRFPIQYVNRPDSNFRGFCGTIASGIVNVGDDITVLPSGKSTRVKSIILPDIPHNNKEIITVNTAYTAMAITLTTEDEIDISRGDMIVHTNHLPRVSNSLKVVLVWMSDEPMIPGQNYYIKTSSLLLGGSFEHINYKIDINTYERVHINSLGLNDIASCKLIVNRPIAADPYRFNRSTGSFIVIDRITNATMGAGMIVDVSRRDQHNNTFQRHYTQEEIDLNAYIRHHFPEWDCKAI